METMIHLGVMHSNFTPTHPDALERVFRDGATALEAGRYTFHIGHSSVAATDSFVAWCEPLDSELNQGDPIHVVCVVPDAVRDPRRSRALVDDVRCALDQAIEGQTDEPIRLVDYVVLTDPDDWSENTCIVGHYA